ncbi:MAG TPA: M13 family peptidase, partial [Bacteroidales bacterium]
MKRKKIMYLMAFGLLLMSCTGNKKPVGIDPANLDTNVKPGDNFYQYANGGWLKNNPMPSEYSRYGSFDKLQEDNDKM